MYEVCDPIADLVVEFLGDDISEEEDRPYRTVK